MRLFSNAFTILTSASWYSVPFFHFLLNHVASFFACACNSPKLSRSASPNFANVLNASPGWSESNLPNVNPPFDAHEALRPNTFCDASSSSSSSSSTSHGSTSSNVSNDVCKRRPLFDLRLDALFLSFTSFRILASSSFRLCDCEPPPMATIFLSHRLRVRSTTTTTTTTTATTRANDSIRPRARQSNRIELDSNASLSPARTTVRRVDDDERRSRARAIDRRTTRVGVYGSTTERRERVRIILNATTSHLEGERPAGCVYFMGGKGYSVRVIVQ